MNALKTIREDGTTRNGFRWPDKGPVEETRAIDPDNGGPCPSREGDGICLGKTFGGMAQGGIPALHILTVRYRQADVLGEDEEKLRVARCTALRRWPLAEYLKAHPKAKANLYKADLCGADLREADLNKADLREADLNGAIGINAAA